MATKYDELTLPGSCLNKAELSEPVFVLRAQDKLAPLAIRAWADALEIEKYGNLGDPEREPMLDPKIKEARELATAMEDWPNRKVPD